MVVKVPWLPNVLLVMKATTKLDKGSCMIINDMTGDRSMWNVMIILHLSVQHTVELSVLCIKLVEINK